MNLRRNLLAGLANSGWSALVGFAVVPFYLKYLGMEAYGLIGFFMTAQVMFQLLDMGMAPTMNREVARCSASGQLRDAGKLLHTLAVIYWCVAIVIGLVIILLAPFIATHWLKSKDLPSHTVVNALMLMGLVVASRWPIGLYQGALLGAQRMTVSSAVNMSMVTLGSVGAVLILAFVSPTIEAFFAWQAFVGLVYAVTLRKVTWLVIGASDANRFDTSELKRIWRFTAGMSAIGLTGVVFSQLDKIILSKVLALEDFGQYMLASVVVSGLYVLITPVFNLIYPRFSALVAKGDIEELKKHYHLGTRLLASILFPAAMLLAVFAKDIVYIWTGNLQVATSTAPVIALLASGSALHGVMHFPYALQLAYGTTRLSLTIYLVLIVVMLPLLAFLPLKFGTVGGGAAWLVVLIFYMLFGTWFMHRRLLPGQAIIWLGRDVGIPLLLSVTVGVCLFQLTFAGFDGLYVKFAGGLILMLILPLASAFTSGELRGYAFAKVQGRIR
ncbi:MAG: oligosaccharide flippase family protein [Hydrogenophaga sp.]|uniref:oligosaccharide flippase family protein n=1 Tax=Hydrogenophaga sp. TaxID=1904254 RepID=UPI002626D0E8|nr:oligosaccharide flippase family protein [Hydrogenophaga sp.]MDM7943732.1 oligosaccharide flippase family protein [Hydrogenophaga sp.]